MKSDEEVIAAALASAEAGGKPTHVIIRHSTSGILRERDALPPSKQTPGAQRWCAWCGDDLPRDRHDVGTCDDRCGAALRGEAGW